MKTNKLPPIHPGEILREEFGAWERHVPPACFGGVLICGFSERGCPSRGGCGCERTMI